MASPTINSLSLGKVINIQNVKNANILPLPMPTLDSDATETFDMLGVTRIITITGLFVGTTATIKTNVEAIEGLCDGLQNSSYPLIVDELGTYQVKVMSFRSMWDVTGISNRCEYVLTCIQGV